MATAEEIYAHPSALARLYFKQERSREMAEWRRRIGGTLGVTHHGRTEIVNSIGLAVFRGELSVEDANDAWAQLENDYLDGYLVQFDILWRAALNRTSELSRTYTPRFGTRALDVLHVSCALELGLKHFLSFDDRQKALAKAVGLKLVTV